MNDKEELLRAATNVLMTPVLELLQNDPHQWSDRPCSTCRAISSIIGRAFGCYAYAEKKARLQASKAEAAK